MLFAIHCLDQSGSQSARQANFDAHKAYLAEVDGKNIKIVTSGPLLGNDGQTSVGSLFIVEARSRDEIVKFHQADPFFKAGIWAQVSIHGFMKRIG